MKKLLEDFKYLTYVIFHPFDGFYEVRFRGKKNAYLGAIILVLYGLLCILKYQYTGFIMNNNPQFKMNSITTFLFGIFPYVLFCISNWSVTAIFEGSGKFGDIFTVVTYALFPKLILDAVVVILSNVVTMEESVILTAIGGIGTVYFAFLVFCGLCVAHEYTAATNIVMILATFVAAIIIIFLAILYITLIQKVVSFGYTFATEFMKRW
ncbi:MAG: Yip1 family protein [Clostridia bacterium]